VVVLRRLESAAHIAPVSAIGGSTYGLFWRYTSVPMGRRASVGMHRLHGKK